MSVFGKPGERLVLKLRRLMQRRGATEHQPALWGDRDFGVAQIASGVCDQRSGSPGLAVLGFNDPEGAIGRDMGRAFAEDAKPFAFEPD